MAEIMTIEVTDDLVVRVGADGTPYLLIDRFAGGLVRIEAGEVRELVNVLILVGGDLAALATGRVADDRRC